jgi:hypothetical protein
LVAVNQKAEKARSERTWLRDYVQVLSVTTPALHNLAPEESIALARRTNDMIAATVAKYSTRFQGLPKDPEILQQMLVDLTAQLDKTQRLLAQLLAANLACRSGHAQPEMRTS